MALYVYQRATQKQWPAGESNGPTKTANVRTKKKEEETNKTNQQHPISFNIVVCIHPFIFEWAFGRALDTDRFSTTSGAAIFILLFGLFFTARVPPNAITNETRSFRRIGAALSQHHSDTLFVGLNRQTMTNGAHTF